MSLLHHLHLRPIEQALSRLNDVVLITESEPLNPPGPRIVYVNHAFERMSGYSEAEILGQSPRILQGVRTAQAELSRMRTALRKFESCRICVTNYRKDGRPFDVEFDVVPIPDEQGLIRYWVSIQRDTTLQTVAASIIANAESVDALVSGVLRDVVEYAGVDGCCWEQRAADRDVWTTAQAVVRNRSTGRFDFGISQIPSGLATQLPERGESRSACLAYGTLPLRSGSAARIVLWNDTHIVSTHAIALVEAVAKRCAISYERLRAESERERLEVRLRKAQTLESVGRLAGGIAHDFNNLLTVIMSNLELLRDRVEPDESGHNEVDEVLRATERARSLVQHLFAFSRQQPVALGGLDLRSVIGETLTLLRRSLGSQITILANIREGLPMVTGDAALLERILINLAVNSRDAIQSASQNPTDRVCGSISIRVDPIELFDVQRATWEELAIGRYLCLSVEDDGPGMPADVRAQAFDPFFTTKAVGSGSGLGLSSVYGAVAQMGGGVRLSEGATGGLLVSIMLPERIAPS